MNGPLHPIEPPGDFDLLDRLLGLAPLSPPDAWFTARTLARCHTSRSVVSPPFSWAYVWRRWAVAGIFALSLGGFGLQQLHRNHTLQTHHQRSAQEAFEVISRVDNESDSSWQDTSL